MTVTLSVSGPASGLLQRPGLGNAAAVCAGCQLTVNPGGIKVLVIIDVSITPSSPPPSSPPPGSESPDPETGRRGAG